MSISVDYTITAREFFAFIPPVTETHWLFASRWAKGVRWLAVFTLITTAAWHALTVGFDSVFRTYATFLILYLAAVVFPMASRPLLIYFLRNYPIDVTINCEGVTLRAKKSVQKIAWASFALTGSAIEFSDHFLLKCGRGSVPIPKRVFTNTDDDKKFWSMVASLSEGRCMLLSVST